MAGIPPSSARWVERAANDLESILLDHAHCEKKAASTALAFIFRCPDRVDLVLAMSRLAREELLHFERVLSILKERKISFRRLAPSSYAGRLVEFTRRPASKHQKLPPRIVDELLVAALIESRSTERFRRLAAWPSIEHEISDLFLELAAVEERHENVYLELAFTFAESEIVGFRFQDLIQFETEILENSEEPVRLHAG